MKPFVKKLIQAGLSLHAAELYDFIYTHPRCSIADAVKALGSSKSSLYRAFEELKEKKLVQYQADNWRQSLSTQPLSTLIHDLENKKRRDHRLIQYFRSLDSHSSWAGNALHESIEVLDEEQTFDRYLELSEMKWDHVFAFGNWEDFNTSKRNIIRLEKTFIKNRLKQSGKAFVVVTKGGPHTYEIIDHKELDKQEERISKKSSLGWNQPFWATAFEGNNYVHLWNMDPNGKLCSTFLNSASVSNFYKNLVCSV